MGNPNAVREAVRDYGWENMIGAAADLRFAVRMLRKNPLFTFVVVFVIALGCGGVTTIFSAMNAIVLRPLPGIADPSRLVTVRPARRDGWVGEQGSYGLYAYLREYSRTLEHVAAWGRASLTIAADGQGTAVAGNLVSANYFEALGLRPAAGRFFAPDEVRVPGSQPVVVVSHAFWRSHLRGDPSAIGRSVVVSGSPFTVIGVAPEGFHGVYTGVRADAWLPLTMQPLLRPRSNLTSASWLWLFGRLRDGGTPGAAQEELSMLAGSRAAAAGETFRAEAAPVVVTAPFTGLPGGEGRTLLGFLSLLLGAAVLVLLIAGVNVATMLSARYQARRREMAVRAALGAGRSRLLRQLLTETLAIFLLGAAGGFVVAVIATAALEHLPLPQNVPLSLELSPDFRVFAFAIAAALLSGLACGVAPALRGARKDLTADLRDDSGGAGRRRTLVGGSMIVGQLALSLVLLVAAGLFIRALNHGRQIDPGFDMTDVHTVSIEPESWGYDTAKARGFYRALRERIAATPGVVAVSYTSRLPLMMGSSPDTIALDGGKTLEVHTAAVDVDYFTTLHLPIVHGHAFRATDGEEGQNVAVVNETLARRLSPDGAAVGGSFVFRGARTLIVGIARDAKYATLDESTPPFAYFPLAQRWQPNQALLVRIARDAGGSTAVIQAAMRSIDSLLPPPTVTALRDAAGFVLLPQRAAAIVTGALGVIGLILAAVGLYGTAAFAAARRTREIGIRMALGANRSRVLRMMMRDGFLLVAAGVVLGLALAAVATQLLAGWLFGLSPLDATTFAGMAAVFFAVALAATYLPARRAAAADPLTALRTD